MPTYHTSTNTVDDFGPGNEVLYVPIWVNGDASNPDCKSGVVYITDQKSVFVQYYDEEGDIQPLAVATRPEDLINMSES